MSQDVLSVPVRRTCGCYGDFYAAEDTLVRMLDLEHQLVGIFQSKWRAAHWDGKNDIDESVASSLNFYTFTAGDFSAMRKILKQK